MKSPQSGAEPKASVIVPTLNRARLLARLLPSFATQEADEPYEVIVVDNGSRDATRQVVCDAGRRWPHVRLVEEPRRGAAQARNAGARAARSPLLIFIDDDMLPAPGVVAEHLRLHAEADDLCLLGNVTSASSRHPFERMMAYVYDGPRTTLARREPTAEDCWSGHMSLRRELFFRLGGFDETFAEMGAEDLDLGVRMIAAGVRLRFAAAAVTRHHFTARFGPSLRRSYRNGVAYGYIVSRHPELRISGQRPVRWSRGARAIELACLAAAKVLEPFSRGEGVPFVPLSFVYSLGLRTAVGRGLSDYLAGRSGKCLSR
jgi:GT2 family glycosyltransferase